MLPPFTPGNSVTITVTASSAATILPLSTGARQIRVSSLAANAISFIAFGTASTTVVIPTTTTNGCPILPGTVEMFTVGAGVTHVAVIGTLNNTLYFTSGDGE